MSQSVPPRETIVFDHAHGNQPVPWPTLDIYSMNADGTSVRPLTSDGHSHSPVWSPDGRQILFIHDSSLNQPIIGDHEPSHHPVELYIMNRNGTGSHLLRHLEPYIVSSAWSPDGKTLLVQNERHLFLLSADGRGAPRQFFQFPAGDPAWSLDGKKLLFARGTDPPDGWTTFVSDADGLNPVQILDSSQMLSEFSWSPSGRQLAADDGRAIFILNSDGTALKQLTHDPDWPSCRSPSWSPDGKRIAFSCMRVGTCSTIAPSVLNRIPQCIRRIFAISVDNPPSNLIPIIDIDGGEPRFAPLD